MGTGRKHALVAKWVYTNIIENINFILQICGPSGRHSLEVMVQTKFRNAELAFIENIQYFLPGFVWGIIQYTTSCTL